MAARRTPSVLTALRSALRELEPSRLDAATVALAKRYARELDDAAVVSASLTKAMRELESLDPDLHDRFLSLATRIEETAVAASIGPKLLAALEQLQMTPRSRSAVAKGGGSGDGSGKRSALDELRDRRENRAKVVDPASS